MSERLGEACEGVCGALSVPFDAAWSAPLGRLGHLLARWNARTNLVGDAGDEPVARTHVVEALVLRGCVEAVGRRPSRVIDVGSGAGLEALVLALAWPDAAVVAIEPRRVRAAFIEIASAELGLRHLRVERRPVERADLGSSADLATSRATFSPARWLEVGASLVHAAGLVALHDRAGTPFATQSGLALTSEACVPGSDARVCLFAHAPASAR